MITLYKQNETDFTHNGLGVLDANIYEPVVEETLNGLFIFSFSYPLFAPHGLEIEGQCIVKVPTPDGNQLFRVAMPKPSMGELKVSCYHIFYDLIDNLIEDTFIQEKSGTGAVDQISSKCQYPHPFQFFSDIDKVASSRLVRRNPVEALLDVGQDNCFLNRWGGELKRDNFNVNLVAQRGKNRDVVIQHRKNLKGYEATIDWQSPITRIMPKGFDELLLPEKYVDSPNIKKYVNPKIRVIEFSNIKAAIGDNENDEEAVPLDEAYDLLRKAAKEMYEVQKVDLPPATYKVEFQELSQTEEYKDFAVLQRVYMADTVTVQHKEDDIDIEAKVVSYKYDPIRKEYTELTLGNYQKNFSDLPGKVDQMQDDMSGMETSILEKAKENATGLINSGFGGHVRFHPERILIMDTDDEMTAEKVWQWNINGLGYSSTGINGPYGLAMTMDGAFVADRITTGTFDAALARIKNLKADDIESGTLKSRNGRMGINLDDAAIEFYAASKSVASTVSQAVGPDGREITYWTIERIKNPKASLSIGVRNNDGSVGNNMFIDGQTGNVAVNGPDFEVHAHTKNFGAVDFAQQVNFTGASFINTKLPGGSWEIENIGGHLGGPIFAPKESGKGSLGNATWTWGEVWAAKWNGVAFNDFTTRGVFEVRVTVVDRAFDDVRNSIKNEGKRLDTFADEVRSRLYALENKQANYIALLEKRLTKLEQEIQD